MKKAISFVCVLALLAIASWASAQTDQKTAAAPAGPAETNYQSAQQFIQAGNYEEAIIRLKTATSIKPDYLEAWALLGSSLTKVKNMKEGIDAYEKALALSPGNTMYISAIALNYRYLENWDKAEEYYTKLIEKDSTSYDGHVNLGFISEKKDDPDRAIRHYEKAVAIKPEDAGTLGALAALYEKQGKEEKRMEYLQRAVAAAPDNYAFKLQLGSAYMKKKDFAKAAPLFEDLVKNNPNEPRYHESLGLILAQMPNRKAEAPAELEETLKLKGNDPHVCGILALVYNELKQYDKAIDAAKRGLDAKAGQEPLLCYQYGVALSKLEKYDEAIAMFQKVVSTKDAQWSELANKEIARQERLKQSGEPKKQ